jgi:2-hydroxymuconate-semialdehyde hydrolase
MSPINVQAPVTTNPEVGRSLRCGGITTNYHDTGAGPPVLLIHGSGPGVTAWANWRLTLPQLAMHSRVIAPDMAGFGYTVVNDDRMPDRAMWLQQMVDLLDALGLEQVTVVGNSFGGAMALALASEHPRRVRDLVLMGAVGVSFPLTDGLDQVWGYTPSPDAMKKLLGVFVHDASVVSDDLVEMRYRASIRADVQSRFAALFPPPRQRSIEALALPEDALRAITHRALLIHGRQDQVIPVAVSERMHQLLQRSRLEVIEGCGHWVQIEHTKRFVQLVDEFLAQGRSGEAATEASQ